MQRSETSSPVLQLTFQWVTCAMLRLHTPTDADMVEREGTELVPRCLILGQLFRGMNFRTNKSTNRTH